MVNNQLLCFVYIFTKLFSGPFYFFCVCIALQPRRFVRPRSLFSLAWHSRNNRESIVIPTEEKKYLRKTAMNKIDLGGIRIFDIHAKQHKWVKCGGRATWSFVFKSRPPSRSITCRVMLPRDACLYTDHSTTPSYRPRPLRSRVPLFAAYSMIIH